MALRTEQHGGRKQLGLARVLEESTNVLERIHGRLSRLADIINAAAPGLRRSK